MVSSVFLTKGRTVKHSRHHLPDPCSGQAVSVPQRPLQGLEVKSAQPLENDSLFDPK